MPSSCPQQSCSVAPRKLNTGWEWLVQPLGNEYAEGSNIPATSCPWPASYGNPTTNNGLKLTADGCPWVAPPQYGVCGCAENVAATTIGISAASSGLIGAEVTMVLDNPNPYPVCGTYTLWHGPVEYRVPSGSVYAVGHNSALTAPQQGGQTGWPSTGTAFPTAGTLTLAEAIPFVLDAYQSVLGRYPDSGALQGYAQQIVDGGITTIDGLWQAITAAASANGETWQAVTSTDGGVFTRCIELAAGASTELSYAPFYTAQHVGLPGSITVKGYGINGSLQPVKPADAC